MRKSLMLLTAATIVVTAPVAANAGSGDRSNSASQVTIRVAGQGVTCRGREWRAVGYAGCAPTATTQGGVASSQVEAGQARRGLPRVT
jgi:hypothetical protein